MNDIQTPADTTAGNESVAAPVNPATDQTQDSASQGAHEAAPSDAESGQQEDQKQAESRSKARREARKLAHERAKEEARTAAAAAAQAEATLDQIRKAAQGREPPKQEDFKTYDDFIIASATYAARQAAVEDRQAGVAEQKQAAERAAEAARQRAAAEAAAMFREAAVDAKTRYADFEAVILGEGGYAVSPALAEMIAYSEVPADLAYHVARDRDLAARLSSMNPVEAARHLGRIEAQITAPKPRIETRAPDPIAPVRGTGSAIRDPEKMSPAEYDAWRSAGGTWTR